MSTNHNGNTEKKAKYKSYSYIFGAIKIFAIVFLIFTVYTNFKGIINEFDRVEQENTQIHAYNSQIVSSGDQTTPFKDYVSVNITPFDLFKGILPILIVLVISHCLYKNFKGKADILESGICGETMVSGILDLLPRDYEVLENVSIQFGERQAEIDFLILSEYGVWIIEVKNYKGYIYGDVKDSKWRQEKISSGGNTYSSEIKNPVKQVNRQLSILKQKLKENGINAYINVAVIFPSASELYVNADNVYSSNSDLIDNIKSNKKVYFSQKDLNEIKTILNQN